MAGTFFRDKCRPYEVTSDLYRQPRLAVLLPDPTGCQPHQQRVQGHVDQGAFSRSGDASDADQFTKAKLFELHDLSACVVNVVTK